MSGSVCEYRKAKSKLAGQNWWTGMAGRRRTGSPAVSLVGWPRQACPLWRRPSPAALCLYNCINTIKWHRVPDMPMSIPAGKHGQLNRCSCNVWLVLVGISQVQCTAASKPRCNGQHLPVLHGTAMPSRRRRLNCGPASCRVGPESNQRLGQ